MGVVLVVDDVEQTCRAVAAVVRGCGHAPLRATTGERALEVLASRPVDLVLLDVMLPGMDGPQVLRAIRADPKTADLPVVICSGVNDPTFRDYLHSQGATDYWLKGQLDCAALEQLVGTYLGSAPKS